jgi:hypothetical protein
MAVERKFIVDVDKLRSEQISVLKAIYKEGTAHLDYYYRTMSAFSNPENRVKTFDTKYYEDVLPIIIDILKNEGSGVREKGG